jgi:hypothetical protein
MATSPSSLVPVSGNTYPVKDQLKALGARWNPDQKCWMVSPDKADAARRIIGGSSTFSPAPRSLMASDKQRMAISRLLGKVENIRMFDSFGGNGEQMAEGIREQIQKAGGIKNLTSRQASEIIGSLICAADDEM